MPPVDSHLPSDRKALLKQKALELGLDDMGFAGAEPLPHANYLESWLLQGKAGAMTYLSRPGRADPRSLLPGAQSLLVGLARYARPPRHPAPIAAYATRADYHRSLRTVLLQLAEMLQGFEPGSSVYVAVDTSPLVEREAAARAGVGWIGKNTMLVHRTHGCYTLLGEVLWTGYLPPDTPGTDLCGSCTRCLEACPTDALTPYAMDPRRCLSYWTIERRGEVPEEFREALGPRAFGCDACIEACPFGTRRGSEEGRLLPTDAEMAGSSLAELLPRAATHFRKSFGWTPVERARKRGFLKGLLLATGNSCDAALRESIRPFLEDSDPEVQECARWAWNRLSPPRS